MILLASLVAASLRTSTPQTHAKDLDATPSKIRGKKNRDRFMSEMNGTDDGSAARTGQKLPAGFAKDQILQDLVQGPLPKDVDPASVKVGVVDYIGKPGAHLIWASGNANASDSAQLVLWLGIKLDDKWLSEPARALRVSITSTSDSIDDFDFHPYNLGDLGQGFGVDLVTGEGYSGGFSSQENLLLFATYQGKLTEVLETPLEFFGFFAGDWHKNGTRSHEIVEESSKLTVSGHKAVPDLVKTLSGSKKRKEHFVFDSTSCTYKTKDKEVLDHAQ